MSSEMRHGTAYPHNIDLVSLFAIAYQYIVRLDISMDEPFGVDVLKARDELIREHQH